MSVDHLSFPFRDGEGRDRDTWSFTGLIPERDQNVVHTLCVPWGTRRPRSFDPLDTPATRTTGGDLSPPLFRGQTPYIFSRANRASVIDSFNFCVFLFLLAVSVRDPDDRSAEEGPLK